MSVTDRSHLHLVNGRVPPHNLDAEVALLGAMLLHARARELADCSADDFYKPANGFVYDAIRKLEAAEKPIEPLTVVEQLRTDGALQSVGGPAAITDILGQAGTSPAEYARIIRNLATSRRLIGAAGEIAELGYDAPDDAASAVLTAVERITSLAVPIGVDAPSTWNPVDLEEVLDRIDNGETGPEPEILARDDGRCLFYKRRVNSINGESESYKSWLALLACKQAMEAGGLALYLDFEDDEFGIISRLHSLGVNRTQIAYQFHYIRPTDPSDPSDMARLDELAETYDYSVAVMDGVTEAMVLHGWSMLDNDDVARFYHHLPRRLANHGAASVLIDHVPKDKENRTGAIGGQQKRAGLTGASYRLDVVERADPAKGTAARVKVSVDKDRANGVRKWAQYGKVAADMWVETDAEGRILLSLRDADATPPKRYTGVMEKVSRFIEEANASGVEPTVSAIKVEAGSKVWKEALDALRREGWVSRRPGERGAFHHSSVKPFREGEKGAGAGKPAAVKASTWRADLDG